MDDMKEDLKARNMYVRAAERSGDWSYNLIVCNSTDEKQEEVGWKLAFSNRRWKVDALKRIYVGFRFDISGSEV